LVSLFLGIPPGRIINVLTITVLSGQYKNHIVSFHTSRIDYGYFNCSSTIFCSK